MGLYTPYSLSRRVPSATRPPLPGTGDCMRRFAIRLGIALAALLVASQFLLPIYAEHRVEKRLTEQGGSADVSLHSFPALGLLFGRGGSLDINAHRLNVDLGENQSDVFAKLDDFSDVAVKIDDSRAGPFSINRFKLDRLGPHRYALVVRGDATAGDVARYAGARLGGGFGQALAGLAASALGDFDRPIPFSAAMEIDTSSGMPTAQNVVGDVAGLPAGPLAQVVANALLGGI